MAEIIREITVDVAKANVFQAIVAKQFDSNSRFLKATITNNGEPLTIPPSASVTINALREDGNAEAFLGSVNDDGTITVPLSNWMLQLDGIVKCDISIVTADSKLTTTMFSLAVEEAAYGGSDISDDPNYDLLIQLLEDCSTIKEDCANATSAANEAASLANTKAGLADSKATLAANAAALAEEKAGLADTATSKANTATANVNTAITNAETATANAEAAATAANEAADKVTDPLQAVNISFDKSNSGLESENVQDAIDEIVIKVGGMAKVESWADVQNIVNLGMAQNVFKVGEQLECGHTKYGTLVWDITDVTPEKLSLCTHKCPVSLQFDAREALYYAETELAAGTYNFTIVTQPWYTADNGKTFQFTLTKPVPQGGQIVLDMTYNAALVGKSVKTYSGGDSTTVIETATITEGSEGTAFGKTDGSVANVNHIQRAIMGSNNYKESALRQWLNSDGAAGTFWTPQTVFDRPPSWETNTAGFINGLDADFLAVVSDTTYDVGLNNVTDGGGKETLTDKFVLLSRDEIYAGSEGGVTQGEPLPYFSEFSDHNSPSTAADSNRIKTNASGTATYWWLRSPYTSNASGVRNVYTSGYLSLHNASSSDGVAPACNIIKNQ